MSFTVEDAMWPGEVVDVLLIAQLFHQVPRWIVGIHRFVVV